MSNKRSLRASRASAALWLSVSLAVGGASAAPAPRAHDGPFGIAMGEPLDQLITEKTSQAGRYVVTHHVALPSGIASLAVDAFPSTGVCLIRGTSLVATDDQAGAVLRRKIDEFAELLKAKYGPYVKTDNCDGLSEECTDLWVQRLNLGKANYNYDFDLSNAGRSDKIGYIEVGADAVDAITSYLYVEYYNVDKDGCDAARKTAASAGL